VPNVESARLARDQTDVLISRCSCLSTYRVRISTS
jgi:hypothetical protein